MKVKIKPVILILLLSAGCGGEKTSSTNLPPVLIVEKSVISAEPDSIVYPSAISSYDPEGKVLNFYWSIEEVPLNSVNPLLFDRTSPISAFVPDVPGKYVLSLTADDGVNVSGPEGITVSVSEELLKPKTVMYKKSPIRLGDRVELSGEFSSDPSGESLSFLWSILDAPSSSTATLSITSAPSTSLVPDVPHGTYTISLTAFNRLGLKDTKTIELTVENNPPAEDLKVVKNFNYYKSVTVASGSSYDFTSSISDKDNDSNFTYTFTFNYSSYNSQEPTGSGFYCPSEGPGIRSTCTTSNPSEVQFYTGDNSNFEGSFEISVTSADGYGGESVDRVVLERSASAPPEISAEDLSVGHIYSSGYYRLYDWNNSSPPVVSINFKNTNDTAQTLNYTISLKERPSSTCSVEIKDNSGSADLASGEVISISPTINAYGSDSICLGEFKFSVKGCFLSRCMEKEFSITGQNRPVNTVTLSVPQSTFNVTCEENADGNKFTREKIGFSIFASAEDPDNDPVFLDFSASNSSSNVNGIAISPASVECASSAQCSTQANLKGRNVCVKRGERCFLLIFCSTVCTESAQDVLFPGKTYFQVQGKDEFSSGPSDSSYVEVKCQ